jgi:crotonobetainyl-CoA:carnitine CoA-transferase CaiB-like acyl-CoA transferase
MREAMAHPQVAARHLLVAQERSGAGPGGMPGTPGMAGIIETLGPVVRLSRTPADPRLPPPALGEHTDSVLASIEK